MEIIYDQTKPRNTKDSHAKLAAQQRFRMAMAFLNPLRKEIEKTWANYGSGKRSKAFSQALRNTLHQAFEGKYPDQQLIPSRVMLSQGALQKLNPEEAKLDGDEFSVTWASETDERIRMTDEIILIVYSPDKGIVARSTDVVTRRTGQMKAELINLFPEGGFHAYCFCYNARNEQYSKSEYLGYFKG